ncbi:hypothetical protein CRV155 [Nile crocodilepox virus]|uniref:Uncharacterized protein n=1 Tax=Nile crocodilepox virus (isolate Crocodylus niloticus/Zimbabwe/Ume/2001) TaxID=1289473 RepID=Q06ZZ6_CPRVZ|nr:hypothetical protein CRV155 [Nile crocodilepox virus]ABJ09046.1 hypothetical protein CRV155 [Nile crocodilepox virus]
MQSPSFTEYLLNATRICDGSCEDLIPGLDAEHMAAVGSHKMHVILTARYLLGLNFNRPDAMRRMFDHDTSKLQPDERAVYGLMHKMQQMENPPLAAHTLVARGVDLHRSRNPHHREFWRDAMPAGDLIEAIIDGLACVLERNPQPTLELWLWAYRMEDHSNHGQMETVVEAVKRMYSLALAANIDYQCLLNMSQCVKALFASPGAWTQHLPWGGGNPADGSWPPSH